jgi:cell division protein FtsQ
MTIATRPRPSKRRRPGPRPRRAVTDPRFSRRRKAVARAKSRRLVARIAIIGSVVLIPWILFASPLLRVRSVEVTGARHTPSSDVAAAAELGPEDNLLLLSSDEVVERVGELPWVSSVEVDRMLPGTVRIRIEERRPALVLSLGAARWTIDAHGRVLDAGTTNPDLPVLAGVQVGTVSPGVDLKTAEATGAMRVWRLLPPNLRAEVDAIFAPTVERITVVLADGLQVRYGAPESMDAKNEVLRALLAQLKAEGSVADYVDIRVPARPAVSLGAPPLPGEVVDPTSAATTVDDATPFP